jgi:hypothetical protein
MCPLSQVNLAAGATVNLDTFNIPDGDIARLNKVHVASSVSCKWEIRAVDNGLVMAPYDTIITSPGSYDWQVPEEPIDDEFIRLRGVLLASYWRITVTNLDAFNAADVYATVYWFEES